MTINGYDLSKYKRKKETKENLFVLRLKPPLNNPLPNPIAKSVRNLSSEAGSLSWSDDQKNSNHIESLQKENPEKAGKEKGKEKEETEPAESTRNEYCFESLDPPNERRRNLEWN